MLLLGDELIKNAGVAVFELVKNAYDADATRCTVSLEGVNEVSPTARIVVEDNGHGMTPKTIRDVWLSPGTRNRKTQRESKDEAVRRTPEHHRMPLGEKGVGRFAVHKLGDFVTLVTRAEGSRETVVEIDWRDFDSDEPLEDIPVNIRSRAPRRFTDDSTGTRIEITFLREQPWTRARARSLFRSVTSVCSPARGPDEFVAELSIQPDPDDWLAGMIDPGQALDQALFRFRARLDDDHMTYDYLFVPYPGMDRVTQRAVEGQRMAFPKPAKGTAGGSKDHEYFDLSDHSIGAVNMELHLFDRERKTLHYLPSDSGAMKDFLDQNGGVRVYRDGIRVYDLGEPGNDWLDLGGRRVNVPAKRIGNNQIIGIVHLDLDASADLIEKTNREGFVENPAYRDFRRAVRWALKQAESERNKDKDRIRRAYATPARKEPVLADLQELAEEIEDLKLDAKVDARLKKYIAQIDRQYREVVDRLLAAAGAGLNLALVLHEVEKGIKSLFRAMKTGEFDERDLLKRAKLLAEQVDSLTWLTRRGGTQGLTTSEIFRQVLFSWQFRFNDHNVKVTNGLETGDEDLLIKCNRRLTLTALMNLVDNSIYWLDTRAQRRRLHLAPTRDLGGNAIVVADNGPGFQDAPEYLTTAFFTRKPDGMGLGLHLADEIMKNQGGKLVFPEKGDVDLPWGLNGAVVALRFPEPS